MRSLAEYVLRGRNQAVLLALLFTFLPFLQWLADAIIALVVLRKGAKEGAIVLMWVLLPSIVMALLRYPELWFYNILGSSIVVYGLALILRSTGSWSLMISACVLLGVFAVIAIHLVMPDVVEAWGKHLNTYLLSLNGHGLDVKNPETQQAITLFSKLVIGMQVAMLMLGNLLKVLLARWWQALLYNPGALAPELRSIRLGLVAAGVMVVILLVSLSGNTLAIDCLPVVVVMFAIAGLSVVHYLITLAKVSKAWIVGFYGLWVVLFPYLTAMLVFIALTDCGWNIRRRVQFRNVS